MGYVKEISADIRYARSVWWLDFSLSWDGLVIWFTYKPPASDIYQSLPPEGFCDVLEMTMT